MSRKNMFNAFTKWAVFCYAILMITLGTIGYVQADSKASLLFGVGCGILLLFSCLAMFMGKIAGSFSALIVTVALTCAFSYRYSVTHGLMQALLAVLSGAMLIFLLVQVGRWKK
jgi:uncharacterized membrane protein (UPF0136 family)